MIKVRKLVNGDHELTVTIVTTITPEELKVYRLNGTMALIVMDRIERGFKELKKEIRKTGEKLIEEIKNGVPKL